MTASGCRVLALFVCAVAPLWLASPALSQETRAGVVTTVGGKAIVVHATAPTVLPLKAKDDVFLRDRIMTGEQSIARVLLGGKAVVTARERSSLTITEVPGTATITIIQGRIAVALTKDKMKPGESVEIVTPNAVAAIRGTVVIAEAFPALDGGRSIITVVRGLIDVTRIDPTTRRAAGAFVPVGALQTISVSGWKLEPLPQPTAITAAQANNLAGEFRVIPKNPPAGSMAAAVQASQVNAARDLTAVLPPSQGGQGNQNQDGGKGKGNENEKDNEKGKESAKETGKEDVKGTVKETGKGNSAGGNDKANGNAGGKAALGGSGKSGGMLGLGLGNFGKGGSISGLLATPGGGPGSNPGVGVGNSNKGGTSPGKKKKD